MNHGVIAGRRPKDWLEGAITYQVVNPTGNWRPYCVDGEHQSWGSFDAMACVSFAANNAFEIQAKQQGLSTNHSDRFLAKMSHTTPQGNYVGAVLDTMNKQGFVLETEWPVPAQPTWDSYYSAIPQNLITEGVRNLITFSMQYEYVGNTADAIRYHLKHAPLMVTIPGHEICALSISDDGKLVTVLDDYIFNQDPGNPFIRTINTSDITDVFKAVVTVKDMSNTKLVKNGTEWGYYLPANSEQALIDKADNFGYPLPKTPDGKVDWANVKPDITI